MTDSRVNVPVCAAFALDDYCDQVVPAHCSKRRRTVTHAHAQTNAHSTDPLVLPVFAGHRLRAQVRSRARRPCICGVLLTEQNYDLVFVPPSKAGREEGLVMARCTRCTFQWQLWLEGKQALMPPVGKLKRTENVIV